VHFINDADAAAAAAAVDDDNNRDADGSFFSSSRLPAYQAVYIF